MTIAYHDRYVPEQADTAKINWLENELNNQIDLATDLQRTLEQTQTKLSQVYQMLGATRTEVKAAKSDFEELAKENERKRQAITALLQRGTFKMDKPLVE